jgi:hypothetical protein
MDWIDWWARYGEVRSLQFYYLLPHVLGSRIARFRNMRKLDVDLDG